jgi:23S rRNA (uracil1939-C5)-methyltransferase
VRDVPKKGGVLVGFHERGSSYVADMRECHTMPSFVSDLLLPLRALVEGLSIRTRLPQVEVAVGDAPLLTALVFRVLETPTEADLESLCRFAAAHRVEVWLQPKGPETVHLLCDPTGNRQEPASALGYELDEFGLRIPFSPTEFTQVNFAINRRLVARAVRQLDPRPGDRVVDLFCGLGNFTLPLATRAERVLGIEGAAPLVERARANADLNRDRLRGPVGGADGVEFRVANLFALQPADWEALGRVDRLLIDPPRDGALAVAQALVAAAPPGSPGRPARIVYVSCNPATLARDAGLLVHTGGWRLAQAGVVNMFPHTAHVESIAVFE